MQVLFCFCFVFVLSSSNLNTLAFKVPCYLALSSFTLQYKVLFQLLSIQLAQSSFVKRKTELDNVWESMVWGQIIVMKAFGMKCNLEYLAIQSGFKSCCRGNHPLLPCPCCFFRIHFGTRFCKPKICTPSL